MTTYIRCKQTIEGSFAKDADNNPVCYKCCADLDIERMKEHGRITLYLTNDEQGHKYVGNWCGTLKFSVTHFKYHRHSAFGYLNRTDVWFAGPDGKTWHGINSEDNTQLCHCRRTKTDPRSIANVRTV